jgi:hypothetical protein
MIWPKPLIALIFFICIASALWGASAGTPESWVPARWQGGPLEVARRTKDKTLPADPAVRDVIPNWYDPATLDLLKNSPINCLLVTWSAGEDAGTERQQQDLVKAYTRLAHERGIAVLGLVYPGADQSKFAAAAVEAGLDGVVLEGEFAGGAAFVEQVEKALRAANSKALVLPIAREAAAERTSKRPVVVVQGVRPSARNLADMGIRSGPSAEPWIDSNIWLVRSFRSGSASRPVWISQEPKAATPGDYIRCAAEAAVAGGRWVVALDDKLRAMLFKQDADALATWRSISTYLKFAEDRTLWRGFQPYGNLAIVLDTRSAYPDISNEYLNLVARRQVPYRVVLRSDFSAASLEGLQAVLAADLAPPTEAERKILRTFAEKGGLVVAGPSWGDPPKDKPYVEAPLGKGRVAVYKDEPPDPESLARDMQELLSPEEMGVSAFNVPSVLTYASTADSGKRVLVQLLNYSRYPAEALTIRVNGNFKTARLFVPEAAPADLPLKKVGNRTEIAIRELAVWGGLLLE